MGWLDWFIAPEGCYQMHGPPGTCVPPGGEYVLAGLVGLIVLLIVACVRMSKAKQ